MRRIVLGSLLLVAATLPGCLPADTRPEPGRLYAAASLPEELQRTELAFETEDGWSLTLDELMVSFGGLQLTGEGCSSYSDARYNRILDLLQPGPQKVAQVWGLDDCTLGFSVGIPSEEAVLGVTVSDADEALMSKASVPVSSPSGVKTSEGMALHVVGTAARDGVEVNFDWGFADELDFGNCASSLETFLPLEGGETIRVTLVVDPRNLFVAQESSLLSAIAEADQTNGNANGRVSVDELVSTTVNGFADNLGEILRKTSYPSMFRYNGDGTCELNLFDKRGPGGGR